MPQRPKGRIRKRGWGGGGNRCEGFARSQSIGTLSVKLDTKPIICLCRSVSLEARKGGLNFPAAGFAKMYIALYVTCCVTYTYNVSPSAVPAISLRMCPTKLSLEHQEFPGSVLDALHSDVLF